MRTKADYRLPLVFALTVLVSNLTIHEDLLFFSEVDKYQGAVMEALETL